MEDTEEDDKLVNGDFVVGSFHSTFLFFSSVHCDFLSRQFVLLPQNKSHL